MMYQLVDNYAAKTNLAVSSIVVCQCKFDESDVWIRDGARTSYRLIAAHLIVNHPT